MTTSTRSSVRRFFSLSLILAIAATVGARTDPGTWTARAPLTSVRGSTMAVEAGGRLFVTGGFDGSSFTTGYLSINQSYDPVTDTWSTHAPMPTARALPGVAAIGGIVYIVGGWNILVPGTYHALDTVEAYDPVTDTWSTKASMPTPRFGMAIAVLNGKLFALGGSAGAATLDAAEMYDPAANSWTTLAPLPAPRYEPSAGGIGGRIYLTGYDAVGLASTTLAYDPASNTWTSRAPMPTNRYGAAYGVVNGRLVVAGGVGTDYVYTSAVESYDPAADSWSTLASLPTQRNEIIGGVVNGVLYAVGGYSPVTNSFTAANDALLMQAAPPPPPPPPPPSISSEIATLTSLLGGLGGGSFASELTNVQRAFAAGQKNAGCGSLNGFANHVRAQTGKLLTPAASTSALAAVSRIQSIAGCQKQ